MLPGVTGTMRSLSKLDHRTIEFSWTMLHPCNIFRYKVERAGSAGAWRKLDEKLATYESQASAMVVGNMSLCE